MKKEIYVPGLSFFVVVVVEPGHDVASGLRLTMETLKCFSETLYVPAQKWGEYEANT